MEQRFPTRRLAPANSNQIFDHAERDPRAARDVEPGQPWIFVEHRTLAEILAAEDGQ